MIGASPRMTKASAILLALLVTGSSLQADEAGSARLIDEISDRVPRLTVAPQYPKNARRDRIEGEVQVC